MNIDEAKQESYVKRLLRGEKKRVDSGKGKKEERISPDDAQGKEIVRKCKAKCDVCSLPYTDPHKFNVHHIDGEPDNTLTRNLTLLCSNCHNSIHGRVDSLIKDYKNTQKKAGVAMASAQRKPAKQQKTVKVNCRFCNGSGRGLTGLYPCPVCHGNREIEVYPPPETCTFCQGTGKNLPASVLCPMCGGTGYKNPVSGTSIRKRRS